MDNDLTFDPRDPRWRACPVGCRPAAGLHRQDCPNVSEALHDRLVASFEAIAEVEDKEVSEVVEEFFAGYVEGATS